MARPTREELEAARGGTVPDVIAPGLRALWCGINPSLYSAAVGHHFARPGNRFWPALHRAGITDHELSPTEEHLLPRFGYGVTNLVEPATARADELTRDQLRAGRAALERKVARYRPRCVAVLGVTAYRTAFEQRDAVTGEQPTGLAGVRLWVLPNPSGLNAHHQLPELAAMFAEMDRSLRGED